MQRILVCDDDGRTVRALRVILRDACFRVEAASSANEALDAAALRPTGRQGLDLAGPERHGGGRQARRREARRGGIVTGARFL